MGSIERLPDSKERKISVGSISVILGFLTLTTIAEVLAEIPNRLHVGKIEITKRGRKKKRKANVHGGEQSREFVIPAGHTGKFQIGNESYAIFDCPEMRNSRAQRISKPYAFLRILTDKGKSGRFHKFELEETVIPQNESIALGNGITFTHFTQPK